MENNEAAQGGASRQATCPPRPPTHGSFAPVHLSPVPPPPCGRSTTLPLHTRRRSLPLLAPLPSPSPPQPPTPRRAVMIPCGSCTGRPTHRLLLSLALSPLTFLPCWRERGGTRPPQAARRAPAAAARRRRCPSSRRRGARRRAASAVVGVHHRGTEALTKEASTDFDLEAETSKKSSGSANEEGRRSPLPSSRMSDGRVLPLVLPLLARRKDGGYLSNH